MSSLPGKGMAPSLPTDVTAKSVPIKLIPATLWKFLVPVAIGTVLWFLPAPPGLALKAWHMFAIFVAKIAGIMTGHYRCR